MKFSSMCLFEKTFEQMVVKNGDECHGRIRKKNHLKPEDVIFPRISKGTNMIKHPPEIKNHTSKLMVWKRWFLLSKGNVGHPWEGNLPVVLPIVPHIALYNHYIIHMLVVWWYMLVYIYVGYSSKGPQLFHLILISTNHQPISPCNQFLPSFWSANPEKRAKLRGSIKRSSSTKSETETKTSNLAAKFCLLRKFVLNFVS